MQRHAAPGTVASMPSLPVTPENPGLIDRPDLHAPIHKALRHALADALQRVGRLDAGDEAERQDVLARLQALFALLRCHLVRENEHLHPALEARQPGATRRVAAAHEEQLAGMEALCAEVRALARPAGAGTARLYRHMVRFVAEQFDHMLLEETQHTALLWQLCDDTELATLGDALCAALPARDRDALLAWIAPAVTRSELAALLERIRMRVSHEECAGVLVLVESHLSPARWNRVARTLGQPPHTPLIEPTPRRTD